MKKLLSSLMVVVGIVAFAYVSLWAYTETLPPASAAGNVPVANGYDWGVSATGQPIQLLSKTVTQINSLTPSAAGQILFCSNCVGSTLCTSSGTSAGAWVTISSFTTANASHCQ